MKIMMKYSLNRFSLLRLRLMFLIFPLFLDVTLYSDLSYQTLLYCDTVMRSREKLRALKQRQHGAISSVKQTLLRHDVLEATQSAE